MSLLLTAQGLLVVAVAITLSLLVERWGRDPRRGGDPDRRDLAARLARGWSEIVAVHEPAHRRMWSRAPGVRDDDTTDPRTTLTGGPR